MQKDNKDNDNNTDTEKPVSEIKTMVINMAIEQDMWETDEYECDDTFDLTYEVEEQ